jgi:NTP pyrophosphatase (non-canonical NTP hydrolase)
MDSTDQQSTLSDLRNVVAEFVDERDWRQFHSPKNLSMALAIEAGELMEHFQWISTEASRRLTQQQREEVGEELADVFCYALAIANELQLDVTSTLLKKMEKNRAKYPANEYRGRFGANDPNPASS